MFRTGTIKVVLLVDPRSDCLGYRSDSDKVSLRTSDDEHDEEQDHQEKREVHGGGGAGEFRSLVRLVARLVLLSLALGLDLERVVLAWVDGRGPARVRLHVLLVTLTVLLVGRLALARPALLATRPA